jgi:hypothetical protein
MENQKLVMKNGIVEIEHNIGEKTSEKDSNNRTEIKIKIFEKNAKRELTLKVYEWAEDKLLGDKLYWSLEK